MKQLLSKIKQLLSKIKQKVLATNEYASTVLNKYALSLLIVSYIAISIAAATICNYLQ